MENNNLERIGGNTPPPSPVQKVSSDRVSNRIEIMSKLNGLPAEIADMFFVIIDNRLYVKVAGLLFMAGKKGYSRIETTSRYDEKKQEWIATTKVYPLIDPKMIETLSRLDPKLVEKIITEYYAPTIAEGRASRENVANSRMHPFLKEMAETRSVGRALRLYTGYGGTTYEELPQAEVSKDEIQE